MTLPDNKKLLKNKKVIEEINRHRWIESEKSGHEISFETASVDWLEKFSAAWMQYHMPNRKTFSASSETSKPIKSSSPKTSKGTGARAKSK